jgi:hypothetical protein
MVVLQIVFLRQFSTNAKVLKHPQTGLSRSHIGSALFQKCYLQHNLCLGCFGRWSICINILGFKPSTTRRRFADRLRSAIQLCVAPLASHVQCGAGLQSTFAVQSRGVANNSQGVAGNVFDSRGAIQAWMKFASVVARASQKNTSVEVVEQISQK